MSYASVRPWLATLLVISGASHAWSQQQSVNPIIAGVGGVVHRPSALAQPQRGARVVFDVTAAADDDGINKGLDRAARLVNLYGAAGLQADDVSITLVFHGEATRTVLGDTFYADRYGTPGNPNLTLIGQLQAVGVEILVCGQALNYKGFDDGEVAADLPIAASAMTAIIAKQADGHAYLPLP